jgi:predicted RNA binding protein YcfA (HicA-like mRNA interferase family)
VSRIPPLQWRQLIRVFERDGFVFRKRSRGGTRGHWIGEKPGVARPIVVPEYDEVGLDIIKANMRTAGMSRERFLELLSHC